MARLGFAAIAALVLGVALALWVAPEVQPPRASEPAASEPSVGTATAPPAPSPAAPVREAPARAESPAPVSTPAPPEAPTPTARPAPDSLAGEPEADSDPPATVGVPTLPEEQREIAAAADFEPDPGAAPTDASEAAPPVDPERSGDLIRRMLALYRQMRD